MKNEDWQLISEIVTESLELVPEVRRKFIEEKCADVPHLLPEVESLLASEHNAEQYFASLAALNYFSFFENVENPEELIGIQIGSYQVIKELGFGGMGSVYLAERCDGKFEQKVALKLLKREMNTSTLREHFTQEGKILATLVHPNIARLLDVGTTKDNIPYLAMEFVDGLPIDEFCLKHQLGLNERLELFRKVCETVDFAHRNLIVHRDLKPSNILVNKEGIPKLLDFGISKILSNEFQQESSSTMTKIGAMTPTYASPEQLQSKSVTTATDIYSLGVILYELLSGHRPFEAKEDDLKEIYKAVLETEPPPPSSLIAGTSKEPKKKNYAKTAIKSFENLESVNTSNNSLPHTGKSNFLFTAPKTLGLTSRSLRGDLDNIILKSLAKEPERRYQTVEQFSMDIWRFIDGLPVSARPATIAYRAKKFYGRNRIILLSGLLIFISLIAGIFVAVSQGNVAKHQAKIASDAQKKSELEAEHARIEEEKANKVTAFMSKIIGYANPSWYAEGAKFGRNARVIDALDDLSNKIDTEFPAQPDVAAELHHKFSEVYLFLEKSPGKDGYSKMLGKDEAHQLEEFRQKEEFHALRALELRRQFYGERHELVAKDLFYSYYFLGKTDAERAKILMQAIQMMRETNPNNLNLPYMLESYAAKLHLPKLEKFHEPYRNAVLPQTDENNYEIAERFYREALPLFRNYYKEDNYAIYSNECALAYSLAMQKDRKDFDVHFAICKQGEETLKNSAISKEMNEAVETVKKALLR